MADFTNHAEENLIEFLLSGNSLTLPATSDGSWWIALHTGDPGETGASNEASTDVWTNYLRQAVARSTATTAWSTAASEGGGGFRKANATTVDFGTASLSSDYVISHISLWTSSSAGNCWFYGDLSTSKTIQNGDPVTIQTTAFGISLR